MCLEPGDKGALTGLGLIIQDSTVKNPLKPLAAKQELILLDFHESIREARSGFSGSKKEGPLLPFYYI